ncbi:MAG: hypothetical protein QOG01_2921 [Pseudonocardiales bacterium]|nr:hypothetical protein [Pseudonocardiales bacterium]
MNDLAEKALQGLNIAQRQVRSRPMLSFGILGFAVSCVVVVAGGQVGAARAARPLTSWLHLQDPHGLPTGDTAPGAVMFTAIVALVAMWIVVVELVRRTGQPENRVWWLAGAWAAPFAIGPPLMDTSVDSYAAFGLLQRAGRDPYDVGAARLGDVPIVTAIDPGSRGTPSSVGPLGTVLQHLSVSVSSGTALGAVIVLRVLGVLVAVWIGRLAADLSGARRSQALTLTVLNPLVLLYVISAPHLDGLMIALGLASLLAANERRWLASVGLACVAGSVSGQAFVLVPIVIAVHALGRRTIPAWRLIGRDVAVAAVTTGVIGVVVTDGFGWTSTVGKQFATHTPFSVAGAIGKALTPIVRGASYDDLAAGGRITAMSAMVCVVVYLIATAGVRPIERTAGYALLALALLAPVLYPWYLLWGTLCIAPTATGTRRICVLALCAAACLLNPPGFSTTISSVITGCALVVVAGAATTVLVRGRRPASTPEPATAES